MARRRVRCVNFSNSVDAHLSILLCVCRCGSAFSSCDPDERSGQVHRGDEWSRVSGDTVETGYGLRIGADEGHRVLERDRTLVCGSSVYELRLSRRTETPARASPGTKAADHLSAVHALESTHVTCIRGPHPGGSPSGTGPPPDFDQTWSRLAHSPSADRQHGTRQVGAVNLGGNDMNMRKVIRSRLVRMGVRQAFSQRGPPASSPAQRSG